MQDASGVKSGATSATTLAQINRDIAASAKFYVSLSSTSSNDDTALSNSEIGGKQHIEMKNEDVLSPMLKRFPSFVPLRRHATSMASLEILVPSAESTLRKATMFAATGNMTATIVGGGVISIPLSFARAGLIPVTALMVAAAVTTEFSLYLLCSAARRTGSTSYSLVARQSYGPGLEFFTTFLIFLYLVFVMCGFMVLLKGIWAPIIITIFSSNLFPRGSALDDFVRSSYAGDIMLLVLLLSISPCLLSRDLHTLRYLCYAGFLSISVLCLAMLYRALERNKTFPDLFRSEVKYGAGNFGDFLMAFPIVVLAFLCSFNVISVHCSLINPTRKRVREVIRKGVYSSLVLMYLFGLAGYLYAYDKTDGNILLNFDPSDKMIFLGRVGCGICTLFAMPVNLLPCREALLSCAVQIGDFYLSRRKGSNTKKSVRFDAESSLFASEKNGRNNNYDTIQEDTSTSSKLSTTQKSVANMLPFSDPSVRDNAIHFVLTFAIIACCYVGAVMAPGVAIVWDIAGSSMAFLIQFIVPASCYIKLRSKGKGTASRKKVYAWSLIIVATFGGVACTAKTVLGIIKSG